MATAIGGETATRPAWGDPQSRALGVLFQFVQERHDLTNDEFRAGMAEGADPAFNDANLRYLRQGRRTLSNEAFSRLRDYLGELLATPDLAFVDDARWLSPLLKEVGLEDALAEAGVDHWRSDLDFVQAIDRGLVDPTGISNYETRQSALFEKIGGLWYLFRISSEVSDEFNVSLLSVKPQAFRDSTKDKAVRTLNLHFALRARFRRNEREAPQVFRGQCLQLRDDGMVYLLGERHEDPKLVFMTLTLPTLGEGISHVDSFKGVMVGVNRDSRTVTTPVQGVYVQASQPPKGDADETSAQLEQRLSEWFRDQQTTLATRARNYARDELLTTFADSNEREAIESVISDLEANVDAGRKGGFFEV